MRRFITFALIAGVCLSVPVSAGAATRKYEGLFEPGGELSFKLEKSKSGKTVINYKFEGFPISCDSGAKTTSGRITFPISVRRNKFDTVAIAGDPQNPKAKLSLHGALKPRGRAEGTLKVSGSDVSLDSGGRDNCTSPKTSWDAS